MQLLDALRRILHHQLNRGPLDQGAEHAPERAEELREAEPLEAEPRLACLEPGEVEQVADHGAEVLRGALDQLELPPLLGGERTVELGQEQVEDRQHRAEGRLELVPHVREEAGLLLGDLPRQLGPGIQLGVEGDDSPVGLRELVR